jgi:hypothetical protein
MVDKKNNLNVWLVAVLALLIGSLFGSLAFPVDKEVEVPVEVIKEIEVIKEVEVEIDNSIDYLALAKEAAMEEYVDDLDDDDVEVSFDRIYDSWSVEFDEDEEGDYIVYFRARLELFNNDDYDDAEDEDEDYDAPLETIEFEVKFDESRDKFRVSY